jgi:hypothetical protein
MPAEVVAPGRKGGAGTRILSAYFCFIVTIIERQRNGEFFILLSVNENTAVWMSVHDGWTDWVYHNILQGPDLLQYCASAITIF